LRLPENRYARDALYLVWLPAYLLLFFLLERRPMETYWATQIPLDDLIPFCEWFAIPYCLWYPLLIGMGLVHTGLAYVLYFGALRKVPAHRAAVLSYIDPVVAVLLSALLLNEKMTLWGILGTVLILGAALLGEWPEKTHKQVS
jgi:drug/metabolite transporter (DMT)-like permease